MRKKWPPWLLTVSSPWADGEFTVSSRWPQPAVTEPWPEPWLSCDLAVTEPWSPWPWLSSDHRAPEPWPPWSPWAHGGQFFSSHGGGGGGGGGGGLGGPGRYLILLIYCWGIPCEIALRGMPLDLADNKSTLVRVMASHYRNSNQCWSRSLSPYGVTRPQWVKRGVGVWVQYESVTQHKAVWPHTPIPQHPTAATIPILTPFCNVVSQIITIYQGVNMLNE